MPYPWGYVSVDQHDSAKIDPPKIGHPKRDRAKTKASRKAARR